MRKHIFFAIVSAVLTVAVSSCTDYPEDWGYEASTYSNVELVATHPDTKTFDIRINSTMFVSEGIDNIKSASYRMIVYNAHKTSNSYYNTVYQGDTIVPAEMVRRGDSIKVTALVENIPINTQLRIGLITPLSSYNMNSYSVPNFTLTEDEVLPQLPNASLTVLPKDAHTVTATLCTRGTTKADRVEMEIGGASFQSLSSKGINATGYYEEVYQSDIDLDRLPVGVYSAITCTATNGFGSQQASFSAKIQVEGNAANSPASDGPQSNYFQLNGTKWAKGNLVYKGGETDKWQFDNNPLNSQVRWNSNYNGYFCSEFFCYGNTGQDPTKQDLSLSNISGNTNYDVAAANMPGWRLPTANELSALAQKCSQLVTAKGAVFYPVSNNRRYVVAPVTTTGTGNLYAVPNVTQMPSNGLFFPVRGRLQKYNNWSLETQHIESYVCYMAGEANTSSKTICRMQINGYSVTCGYTNMSVGYYRYYWDSVRPVKTE